MKVLYTKASAFRKKEFSVHTSIVKDNDGKRLVVKEAVYECGMPHLHSICDNQQKILAHYPHCDVAKSWMEDGRLYTEFVEGIPLSSLYADCIRKQNKEEFFKVFDRHVEIAFGGTDNICEFESSADFLRCFDNSFVPDNTSALQRVNFEATVGNIIFRNGDFQKPCFIDYEWFFDFPVPAAFVKYNLICTLYLSIGGLNAFITQDEFVKYIFQENEEQWCHILLEHFVTGIDDSDLYGTYQSHRKPSILFSEKLSELENSIEWHQEYLAKQQGHIENQDARLADMEKSLEWHHEYLTKQQAHVEWQDGRLADMEKSLEWHHEYLTKQQAHIENLTGEITDFKQSLNWHIERLKAEMECAEEQGKKLAEKDVRISELAAKIAEMENDFWWRLGAAFRRKNRLIKNGESPAHPGGGG
ncbi:MAG: hypothetical protein LBH85_01495, partial [Treponema sp.]|nr:hypothetical protein [Treponema sp.]